MSLLTISILSLAVLISLSHGSPLSTSPLKIGTKSRTNATYVSSIDQCPPLSPRQTPPTSVHDLRPDDFSYTMALGDSISAGALLRGLQSDGLIDLSEWRGQSYAAGIDDGAITIPNMIKHYNPHATGGSRGYNVFLDVCFGKLCPAGSWGWNDAVDQLNAAQSGSLASNLPHQVHDYLIPQVRKWNIPAEKFKYINIQIGSNDLCWLCAQATWGRGRGSADDFEANIRTTLEALRAAIPNSVVNLIAVFKLSDIFKMTLNQPYCSKVLPLFPHKVAECACSFLGGNIGDTARDLMDQLADQYNQRLVNIATDYQKANYSDFAVIWQPPVFSIGSYPIEALSNVDCFHPSLKTHELVATNVWNRLIGTAEEKSVSVAWTASPTVRCLEEDDRILTKSLVH